MQRCIFTHGILLNKLNGFKKEQEEGSEGELTFVAQREASHLWEVFERFETDDTL